MSWQHPETSYLPTTLSALQAAKTSPCDLIAQRHAAWQQAFRGLYYALRHRKCDAFYLATPQVSWALGDPQTALCGKVLSASALTLVQVLVGLESLCRQGLEGAGVCSLNDIWVLM